MTEHGAADPRRAQHDRGQAIERTALAWTRSALALAVIAALAVRRGEQGDLPEVAYPLGVILFAAALGVWMFGSSIYRRRSAGVADPTPRVLAFKVMTIGTIAVAALAVVLAVPS